MKRRTKRLLLVLMLTTAPLVSAEPISALQETVPVPPQVVMQPVLDPVPLEPVRFGTASWYSENDPAINLYTANGEVFDDSALTCATWNTPFGTRLKVTNMHNGKSVVCRVNDRGPAKRLHRIVDLTKTAFSKIADTRKGLTEVSVVTVSE